MDFSIKIEVTLRVLTLGGPERTYAFQEITKNNADILTLSTNEFVHFAQLALLETGVSLKDFNPEQEDILTAVVLLAREVTNHLPKGQKLAFGQYLVRELVKETA